MAAAAAAKAAPKISQVNSIIASTKAGSSHTHSPSNSSCGSKSMFKQQEQQQPHDVVVVPSGKGSC